MHIRTGARFSELTTLRVGGPAQSLVEVADATELVEAIRSFGRDDYLVIGGGSNLLVADAGLERPVVAMRSSGVTVRPEGEQVRVVAAAGESWSALVERAVAEGWSGVEALGGIPGSVGATPVQNVGAYGQEVADVITGVTVLDRRTQQVRTLDPDACHFRYRSSAFKDDPDLLVVLEVELTLTRDGTATPVRYAELASRLGVATGDVVPPGRVHEAVIELRRAKGMVLDEADHDTWSAGSFFTNPVVDGDSVPEGAPSWPVGDGRMKVSAAWLIDRAGFGKGYGAALGSGRARLSSKHTLAITNRGGATAADVVLLARTVRQGVSDTFGVVLEPEPTLVGVAL